ncbi:putative wimple/ift172 [Schistosoma mansoni]|uniref:putative wimple/ift172 n=1 Tax=Schistosoma mansoni TaxID=6183 RepID=UPI00022DCA0C|nr:putative wimple/ift172 [Schistosoma mansoni]|eukprot:XP_018654470.1 putative wimple/ift172 [Schistosoma mansoni]
MYRTIDRWEDAYRVASSCTEQPELRKQVAYLWAKHLGGESAVRMLLIMQQNIVHLILRLN